MTSTSKSFIIIALALSLTCVCARGAYAELSKVYWSEINISGRISRSNADGSGKEVLTDPWNDPEDIAVDTDGGKVYWVSSSSTGRIQRSNLDGSSMEDIVIFDMIFPAAIALDLVNDKLYWGDYGTDSIWRCNLDGTDPEAVVTGLDRPDNIVLDTTSEHIYWTDSGTLKIQRSKYDGSDVTDLVTGLGTPEGLAIDFSAMKMYWTDAFPVPSILKAPLGVVVDHDDIETVISSVYTDYPRDLALDLDAGEVYWTDSVLDVIRKAKLDGTMVTEVQTRLVNPVGIALSFDEAAVCEGDLDGDDDIDQSDLGLLLAAYGISDGGDLDDDGDTDQADLGILLSVYGTSCS